MVSTTRMYGISVRQLEFIYNAHSPRCDVFTDGNPQTICRTLWTHIRGARDEWDVLRLSQLPSEAPTLRLVRALAEQDGHSTGTWDAGASPFVSMTGSWENYFKSLARKHRSNVRNRLNRLDRLGRLRLEIVTGADSIREALRAGLEIEAKAWKARAGTAILCRPDLVRFYQGIGEKAAERGWLRLYFLTLNGRRIAFDFSLLYRNRLYVLKPGYDPEFAPYSPYNSLCYLKLKDAFENGIEECDFLGINDDWKMDWTSEVRPHTWLYVFSKSLRSSILHALKFRISPGMKRFRVYRRIRDAGLKPLWSWRSLRLNS
jgi:CelD/BcsL family acetyltransferase involved in cellulose biosynthesis